MKQYLKDIAVGGMIGLGTLGIQSCSDDIPGAGRGDDLDRPYDFTIKRAECTAKTKQETAFILEVGIRLDRGDYKTPLLTRIAVDIPGGGTYNFTVLNKFGQNTGKTYSSNNPDQTHLLEEGDQIIGSVFATNPGTKPNIELFTTDPNFGNETEIGEYRSTCEKKNIIGYKAVCFKITPNNHCQGTGIINGIEVSEASLVQGSVSLVGMSPAPGKPIIVTIRGTNGVRQEIISPVGSSFPFSFQMLPGDDNIEFNQNTTGPIPLSNSISMNITFNNRQTLGLNQPTLVITTGDSDCITD